MENIKELARLLVKDNLYIDLDKMYDTSIRLTELTFRLTSAASAEEVQSVFMSNMNLIAGISLDTLKQVKAEMKAMEAKKQSSEVS